VKVVSYGQVTVLSAQGVRRAWDGDRDHRG
jgi:hypothetical protein